MVRSSRARFLICAGESSLARSLTLLFDQLGDITICDNFSAIDYSREKDFTLVVGSFESSRMQIELSKICSAWPEIPILDIALNGHPKKVPAMCNNYIRFEGGVRPEQLYRVVREIIQRWQNQD